jgi:hypothetical protein
MMLSWFTENRASSGEPPSLCRSKKESEKDKACRRHSRCRSK